MEEEEVEATFGHKMGVLFLMLEDIPRKPGALSRRKIVLKSCDNVLAGPIVVNVRSMHLRGIVAVITGTHNNRMGAGSKMAKTQIVATTATIGVWFVVDVVMALVAGVAVVVVVACD